MTTITNDPGGLLRTIEEAAADLNVGRSTVYELIRQKELEFVKIGRCTRIPRDSLYRFVDRLRKRGHHDAV